MLYDPAGSKLKLNEAAPYFSLPATDGKIYSISDFAKSQALAIIFTSNHCPIAQAYEQRIFDLVKEFLDHSVAIVAICSNDGVLFPEDSFENMVAKSKKYHFAYPYLQDSNQTVANAYSAALTPEVFLFNSKKLLCYHGALDDNYEDESAVSQRYLAQSIKAVLEGSTPEPALTPIHGCSIKFSNS